MGSKSPFAKLFMTNIRKILGEIVWKLKLDLPERILEKLYEQGSVGEYVALAEGFDAVSFEILYEKVAILGQSKLIEFYTAPEAYAVFDEPDFIRAKIRAEGIQYWKDHSSFLRKHKTSVRIAASGLTLIVCSYFVIHLATMSDRNILIGDGMSQRPQSGSSGDSATVKSSGPTTPPPKSPLTNREDQAKPKKITKEA